MKQLLLFLLLFPLFLSAYPSDPRIPKTSLYDGVKSMEVTYIFVIKSGNDTGMSEKFNYDENGMLTDYEYDQHLMKNLPYHLQMTYRYQSEDAWTQMIYKNRQRTDSIIVRGAWANSYHFYQGSFHEKVEFRGDSSRGKVLKDGDTLVRPFHAVDLEADPFWDYHNAGKFANKSLSRSVDSDTTRYLDTEGKCMVMVVNFYDNNFKPVKTDYYNFSVKRFDFLSLPYDSRQDMTFFLFRDKKGKWSFEITRKYNEKGWLVEEFLTDAHPGKGGHGNPMEKLYKYTLY